MAAKAKRIRPVKMWAVIDHGDTVWDAGFEKTPMYDRPMMLIELCHYRDLLRKPKGKRNDKN